MPAFVANRRGCRTRGTRRDPARDSGVGLRQGVHSANMWPHPFEDRIEMATPEGFIANTGIEPVTTHDPCQQIAQSVEISIENSLGNGDIVLNPIEVARA